MKALHLLDKERGETLSELLRRFKKEHAKYADLPMTYAGRLDPMAEGLVILLVGEAVHEKEIFLKLDKTYEVDILFGFATDTGDVLGELIESPTRATIAGVALNDFINATSAILGTHTDPYPIYSSKPVKGVPLFALARAGKLEDVEIPEHTYAVVRAEVVGFKEIAVDTLVAEIEKSIGLVKGDFRQAHIVALWKEHTRALYGVSFGVGTVRIQATSGAYMRGIAEKIGAILGVPALALRIKREQIGEYTLPKRRTSRQ